MPPYRVRSATLPLTLHYTRTPVRTLRFCRLHWLPLHGWFPFTTCHTLHVYGCVRTFTVRHFSSPPRLRFTRLPFRFGLLFTAVLCHTLRAHVALRGLVTACCLCCRLPPLRSPHIPPLLLVLPDFTFCIQFWLHTLPVTVLLPRSRAGCLPLPPLVRSAFCCLRITGYLVYHIQLPPTPVYTTHVRGCHTHLDAVLATFCGSTAAGYGYGYSRLRSADFTVCVRGSFGSGWIPAWLVRAFHGCYATYVWLLRLPFCRAFLGSAYGCYHVTRDTRSGYYAALRFGYCVTDCLIPLLPGCCVRFTVVPHYRYHRFGYCGSCRPSYLVLTPFTHTVTFIPFLPFWILGWLFCTFCRSGSRTFGSVTRLLPLVLVTTFCGCYGSFHIAVLRFVPAVYTRHLLLRTWLRTTSHCRSCRITAVGSHRVLRLVGLPHLPHTYVTFGLVGCTFTTTHAAVYTTPLHGSFLPAVYGSPLRLVAGYTTGYGYTLLRFTGWITPGCLRLFIAQFTAVTGWLRGWLQLHLVTHTARLHIRVCPYWLRAWLLRTHSALRLPTFTTHGYTARTRPLPRTLPLRLPAYTTVTHGYPHYRLPHFGWLYTRTRSTFAVLPRLHTAYRTCGCLVVGWFTWLRLRLPRYHTFPTVLCTVAVCRLPLVGSTPHTRFVYLRLHTACRSAAHLVHVTRYLWILDYRYVRFTRLPLRTPLRLYRLPRLQFACTPRCITAGSPVTHIYTHLPHVYSCGWLRGSSYHRFRIPRVRLHTRRFPFGSTFAVHLVTGWLRSPAPHCVYYAVYHVWFALPRWLRFTPRSTFLRLPLPDSVYYCGYRLRLVTALLPLDYRYILHTHYWLVVTRLVGCHADYGYRFAPHVYVCLPGWILPPCLYTRTRAGWLRPAYTSSDYRLRTVGSRTLRCLRTPYAHVPTALVRMPYHTGCRSRFLLAAGYTVTAALPRLPITVPVLPSLRITVCYLRLPTLHWVGYAVVYRGLRLVYVWTRSSTVCL